MKNIDGNCPTKDTASTSSYKITDEDREALGRELFEWFDRWDPAYEEEAWDNPDFPYKSLYENLAMMVLWKALKLNVVDWVEKSEG